MSEDQELLHFNGVNGSTGDYGLPPMAAEDLSKLVQGEADIADDSLTPGGSGGLSLLGRSARRSAAREEGDEEKRRCPDLESSHSAASRSCCGSGSSSLA